MKLNRKQKAEWYRWTDHSYNRTILFRVSIVLFLTVSSAGLSTYQTFPGILLGLGIFLVALVLFLILRAIIRRLITIWKSRKSQRGEYLISLIDKEPWRA
jgi:polyferredoxin